MHQALFEEIEPMAVKKSFGTDTASDKTWLAFQIDDQMTWFNNEIDRHKFYFFMNNLYRRNDKSKHSLRPTFFIIDYIISSHLLLKPNPW